MIDIFFEKMPHTNTHHSNPACFYAYTEVRSKIGSYYHVLLTEEQYAYRVKNRLTCTTWRDMITAKPSRAGLIIDEKGGVKTVPEHVFGDAIYDPSVDEDIMPTKTVAVTRAALKASNDSAMKALDSAKISEDLDE